ncbi:hypothetical protein [Streptacidiphilus sp. MAP5-3]|uniref:hypothetical protein n=1 Tax=unclassified Streptacidiphilus TaxID=2643834 RepID=UPI0035130A10
MQRVVARDQPDRKRDPAVHIELTWPRRDAAHRTLTIPLPRLPAAGLLRPGAAACADAVMASAATASGAGAFVQLALPVATRLVRQSLDRAD